jgi:uncharacterized protein
MPTLDQARAWYQGADVIHDFDHIIRVYRMAERIGRAEAAQLDIVHAAALLHDADELMAESASARANHHERSADFAALILGDEGWPSDRIERVQHCIRAHRFRGTKAPQTLEAQVLFDADKLDAIGAIGAARALGYAALHGNPFYAEPSPEFLESWELAEDEVHTAYHEYLFKLARIPERLYTATGKAIAQERVAYMREFFERLGMELAGEK